MTKLPKAFLIISFTAFLAAFTEAGSDIGWGILKPVSAISFILFFITNLVASEMAKYDQEEHLRMARAARNPTAQGSKPSRSAPEDHRKTPAFATAVSQS